MKVPVVVTAGPCQHLVMFIFHCNCSGGYIVVSQNDFNLHFSDNNEVEHLDISLLKCSLLLYLKHIFRLLP